MRESRDRPGEFVLARCAVDWLAWPRILSVWTAAVLCVGVLATGLVPAASRAETPRLSVVDLGQPLVPVISGQPPVSANVEGTCAEPFSLEANCPSGSWPGLGSDWGSAVAVAGGDSLALDFTSSMVAVRVASTSNYVPGESTPSGQSVENYDVLASVAATPTPESNIWRVTLPQLDIRATGGYTFSVVGSDTAGHHDYALTIRSPRYEDETRQCGMAYYSTELSQYLCAADSVPPGTPLHGGHNVRSQTVDAHRSLKVSSVATFAHAHLRLMFTVPMSGTMRIKLIISKRVERTIVRQVQAAGRVAVVVALSHYRPTSTRHIAVMALLRASGHHFGVARTITVN